MVIVNAKITNGKDEKNSYLKFEGDFLYIDNLAVKDPKNFGKGLGKKAFIETIKGHNKVALSPFGVFYDKEDVTYIGRQKYLSIEDMDTLPLELANKFYIPILQEEGYKTEIVYSEFHFYIKAWK